MKRKTEPDDDAAVDGADGATDPREGKRPKTEEDALREGASQPPPGAASNRTPAPAYGSKEYWEARYKSHHLPTDASGGGADFGDNAGGNETAIKGKADGEGYVLDGVVLSKEAIKPGHEWYFTYDELRPLVLPLILGGEDVGNEVAEGWAEVEEGEGEDEWAEVEEEEGEEGAENDVGETAGEEAKHLDADAAKPDDDPRPGSTDENEQESGDEAEQPLAGIDPSTLRPKRILEIGCGDKPLGTPLAVDLTSMQSATGVDATCIVEEITCVDYSEVVVQSLIEEQKGELESSKNGDTKEQSGKLQPLFRALDARALPLPSDTYDLILEKGTLDAMLSDEQEGLTNCVQIVKEMARVTNYGGSILIVSHLNANEAKGMGWLEDVVFRGLKEEFDARQRERLHLTEETGTKRDKAAAETAEVADVIVEDSERSYVWSVEVHGGDGKFLDANGEEMKAEDVTEDAIPIYGPAVYIVKKKGVPASIARELFGKRRKDGDEDREGDEDKGDDGDNDTEGMMEMPPVKLEFLTY